MKILREYDLRNLVPGDSYVIRRIMVSQIVHNSGKTFRIWFIQGMKWFCQALRLARHV